MASLLTQNPWALAFKILESIVACLVCLFPMLSTYRIYKQKSTEGFQCIPDIVSLFNNMIRLYYAFLKQEATLFIITINIFCRVMETGYIAAFIFYASEEAKIVTLVLFLLFDVFALGSVFLSTFFVAGATRIKILGYIGVVFALTVFVASLCFLLLWRIKVIRTKIAEYLPLRSSLHLALNAVVWFFYGILNKDLNVAVPTILEFIFGVLHTVLYMMGFYVPS